MARPKAVVDATQVEAMASIGCSVDEIASIVGASKRTLQRRFGAVMEKGRSRLKRSLRKKQVDLALSGNATMLIWLGKNMLDQTDKRDVTTREEVVEVEHVKPKVDAERPEGW